MPYFLFPISSSQRAQGALGFVLMVGGVIVLAALTLAFLMLSFINTTASFQAANQALAIASGGVYDAVLHLIRNKDFSAPPPVGYTVPQNPSPGTSVATVTITPSGGQLTIVSSASVRGNRRKVQAVVSVDPATGKVTVLSWQLAL